MLKRILTAACAVALAAGCTGTRETTGSTSGGAGSSTTTTGGTSAGTGSGSSSGGTTSAGTTGTSAGTTTSGTSGGSSGGIDCGASTTLHTIADVRQLSTAPFTAVCLTDVVATYVSSPGNPKPDGGTQFDGKWYVVDPSTNDGVYVFKSKNTNPLDYNPARGDKVDVAAKVTFFPGDAGVDATVELATRDLDFNSKGTATLPAPVTVPVTALAPTGSDESAVGKYVTVPAGTYTQDNAAVEMHSGNFQDGVKLTDGAGNVILIDTFDFKFTSGNCLPNDGGFPDFTQGGFNGMFDHTKTPNGSLRKVLFYGHCGQ